MGWIDHLTEKPWEANEGPPDTVGGKDLTSLPIPKVGLRVILAVVTILFSLFLVVYVERMTYPDWRPFPDPWILWLNTALLVMSSVAMQWATVGAERGQLDGLRNGLLAGGGFAFAFLAGQLLAWQQMVDLGYFAATNPANAFFYLFTGLHGVHLLGGLVAWGRTTARVWRGDVPAQVRVAVELCAFYWHFLLVVWMVLFGLLLLT